MAHLTVDPPKNPPLRGTHTDDRRPVSIGNAPQVVLVDRKVPPSWVDLLNCGAPIPGDLLGCGDSEHRSDILTLSWK